MIRQRQVWAVSLMLSMFIIAGRESSAVIYKYVDEKGDIIFADDLQKIPEQKRASAVMVSGGEEQQAAVRTPEEQNSQRARMNAIIEAARLGQDRAEAEIHAAFRWRLILSGSAVAVAIALLFIAARLDALKERRGILNGIRASLVAGLVIFLAVVHFQDVAGAIRKTGDSVGSPFADIQERQAARGKKAAEALKVFNKMIDQVEQKSAQDVQRIEKKIEDAEQGK